MEENQLSIPGQSQLDSKIDQFTARYLSPAMVMALKKSEDPLVAALALMQHSFELLRIAMETEEEAIDMFEDTAAMLARGWRGAERNHFRHIGK